VFGLDVGHSILLLLCLLCVCAFEFINGFHDTANAVATVIYTNSMKPWHAVVLSGVLNGLGVFVGGTAVAMGIINMLPVETLVDQNTAHSLGMVGAILLTAIFWNLGTWLLSIPASSSHTLVGSILGVGIAYSLLPGTGEAAVNWQKAGEVGLSLLISPLFGFMLAMALLSLLGWVFRRNTKLFTAPEGEAPPPMWIRSILISTCGLVSFSHGSNDGQKGIGLMMLILIGIIPAKFALFVQSFVTHQSADKTKRETRIILQCRSSFHHTLSSTVIIEIDSTHVTISNDMQRFLGNAELD
jgi:phosphate/sulfate permease